VSFKFWFELTSEKKQNDFKDKVKGVIDQLLQPNEVELDEIMGEVWEDLSALYYKYEDEDQKKAFREVMNEIALKINEGKWESVYNKLYRVGQKEKTY